MEQKKIMDFQFNIEEEREFHRGGPIKWDKLLMDILCSVFFVMWFLELVNYKEDLRIIGLIVTVVIAVIRMIYAVISTKYKLYYSIIVMVVMGLLDMCMYNRFINAVYLLINHISDLMGETYGNIYIRYEVSGDVIGDTLMLITLAIAVGIVIWSFTERNGRITAFFLILFISVANCTFDKGISVITGLALLSMIVLILEDSKYKDFGNRTKGFRTDTILMIVIGIVIICSITKMPTKVNVLSGDSINSSIVGIAERIIYGSDGDDLPDGNIRSAKEFNHNGDTDLIVTMEVPQSMYLKGYVGGRFCDGEWTNNDNEKVYQQRDLFYWLHKNNFYGQNQLAKAAITFDDSVLDSINSVSISVEKGNRKYIYAPYELYENYNGLLNEDCLYEEQVKNPIGNRQYEYKVVENQITDYPQIVKSMSSSESNKKIYKYKTEESHYNQFVYDYYTSVDESSQRVLADVLGDYQVEYGQKHLDYKQAKEKILDYLGEHITYNEKIELASKNFMSEFLQIKCQGYSVHYATAAALMFRYYGIPARYVEGYLITPNDAKSMESKEPFAVTNDRQHAWVEYYQDGAGWIPFEVTPPYIGVMDTTKLSVGNKEINKEKQEEIKKTIKDENYQKEQKQRGVKQNSTGWLLPVIMLVLILIALGIYLYYGHKIKSARKTAFESDDYNAAVIARVTYMLMVLTKIKMIKEYRSMWEIDEDLNAILEGGEEVIDLYQQARYSNGTISCEQMAVVTEYQRGICQRAYDEIGIIKRVRWNRCQLFNKPTD